jgi:hypothetical protein
MITGLCANDEGGAVFAHRSQERSLNRMYRVSGEMRSNFTLNSSPPPTAIPHRCDVHSKNWLRAGHAGRPDGCGADTTRMAVMSEGAACNGKGVKFCFRNLYVANTGKYRIDVSACQLERGKIAAPAAAPCRSAD